MHRIIFVILIKIKLYIFFKKQSIVITIFLLFNIVLFKVKIIILLFIKTIY